MQILSLFTHADTGTNTFVVIWSVKHESVKMQHLLLHEIACANKQTNTYINVESSCNDCYY